MRPTFAAFECSLSHTEVPIPPCFSSHNFWNTNNTNEQYYTPTNSGSSSSSRSQFIDWQRRNLSQTRKEIATWNEGENGEQMMSWTSMSDEGRVSSRGGGSSRMGPLIAAMPSQRKRQMREGRKEQKQLQRSGNIGSGNTAALIGNNPNNKSKNSNNADKKDPTLIATALRTLEQDMSLLDNLASLQPQLSGTEVGLLLGAVLASGVGPIVFPGTSVTEVLAPAAAACEFGFCCCCSRSSIFFSRSHLITTLYNYQLLPQLPLGVSTLVESLSQMEKRLQPTQFNVQPRRKPCLPTLRESRQLHHCALESVQHVLLVRF
jgi:hypothetical protein